MDVDYGESCKKAELAGYKEITNIRGFNGSYFVDDDGKLWIHDLFALARKMRFETEQDVIDAGYNLEDYEKYRLLSEKEMQDLLCKEELLEIFGGMNDEDELVYLSDGVYMTPEGELIEP